jgi:hypothetical protein
MENLKIMKTVTSENRPSFNDWAKEFKVSSGYFVVERREVILPQTYKPKVDDTKWERFFRMLKL